VPFLGSAIALTFDVGYFFGIDVNFFSIFSVGEHINFALEALPIAIVLSALIALLMSSKNTRERLEAKVIRSRRSIYIVSAIALAILAWGLYHAYVTGVWLPLWTGAAIAIVAFTFERSKSIYRAAVFSSTVVLTLSFVFGYRIAREYLETPSAFVTVKTLEGTVQAKLIRSGERGVLFFDPSTKTVFLIPWSEIKQISQSGP
jgi:hypothetical protein